jgi:hypothetical protein
MTAEVVCVGQVTSTTATTSTASTTSRFIAGTTQATARFKATAGFNDQGHIAIGFVWTDQRYFLNGHGF